MNAFARLDPAAALADPRLFADFEERISADLGAGLTPFATHTGGASDVFTNFGFTPGMPVSSSRIWRVLPDGRFYSEDPVREAMQRAFATNTLPTYPGGGPQVTVDTALRTPQIIARALVDLAYSRFVADRILSRGTPQQVASGAAVFQRAEPVFPDRTAEEVGIRSAWPRSGWTMPDLFAAAVKKFGLEAPVADEARRRNAIDELARAQRKIANAVVKFVDNTAMTIISADPAIQTMTATAAWSAAGAKIILDIATARNLINNIDLGYEIDTLVVNPAQELSLLTDATIQGILPREGGAPRNAAVTGTPVPILGLQQILVTNQIAAGTILAMNSGVVGSIADEQPLADEGYTTYQSGVQNNPPLYVKTYREEGKDETVIRGARFPAMWISEPKAVVKITGA
jgi:hypothetical protein